ncbi:MAG: hypothetical protein MJZ60_00745 [Bacteroidaceae bacterium]|nr:hypothetical protein [Bacteroidaceae bacterium]
MNRILFLSVISAFALQASAQKVTFRGVNHCGIYPNEKNLLKEWPAEGKNLP